MSVVGRVWAAALATSLLACIHDVYRSEPIGPPGSRRPETLRVLVFGDFGYQSIPQRLTAGAMRRATRARPFDLALELGDNLYYCGPDPTRPGAETCRFEDDGATVAPGAKPPDDPLFRVNEAPLAGCAGAMARRCPSTSRSGTTTSASRRRCARPVLGEVETMRRRACLAVARRTPTWIMPARHYVIDRGPVRFVVLDTNVTVRDYGGFTLQDEIAFVREATATCGAERHCFLVGHHPPAVLLGERAASPHRTRRASSSSSPPLGQGPRVLRGPRAHAPARLAGRPRRVHLGQHRDGRLQGLHDSLARARAGPLRELGVGVRGARGGRARLPDRVRRHERRGPPLLRGRHHGAVPVGLVRLTSMGAEARHGAGSGSRANARPSASTRPT